MQLVSKTYQTGVKLTQEQMQLLEKRLQRLKGLEKWFVLITPLTGTTTLKRDVMNTTLRPALAFVSTVVHAVMAGSKVVVAP